MTNDLQISGVNVLLESIKEKWNSSNIAGIFIDNLLQIFDGRHRLTALKSLSKEEFEAIFGKEGQENVAGGVRINIYKDLDPSFLIFLSQSKFLN